MIPEEVPVLLNFRSICSWTDICHCVPVGLCSFGQAPPATKPLPTFPPIPLKFLLNSASTLFPCQVSGFGPLKGGFATQVPPTSFRDFLAGDLDPALAALGNKSKFELVVGLNGLVWVSAESVKTTIEVVNVLTGKAS